ncbi:hypothetical protein D3C71_1800670 [compost metagenome]
MVTSPPIIISPKTVSFIPELDSLTVFSSFKGSFVFSSFSLSEFSVTLPGLSSESLGSFIFDTLIILVLSLLLLIIEEIP